MYEIFPVNEQAYCEWKEYREVEKRKKIGPMAERKQRTFLGRYPPPAQQEIVDQSIMNSWQGLFAYENRSINTQQHQNTRGLSKPEQVRAAREAARARQR